ncbi:hypothetical protein Sjap_026097 [Stephania japonica]|uniref:Uncharacterized protein n=1 Tax=Stephania japonica TaxID=461633 RepID=A0AAP0E2Z7_9MAGN
MGRGAVVDLASCVPSDVPRITHNFAMTRYFAAPSSAIRNGSCGWSFSSISVKYLYLFKKYYCHLS